MSAPLCGAAVLVLALALALRGLDQAHFQVSMSAILALLNLGTMILFLARARRSPGERWGWLLLAGSVPLILAGNFILAVSGSLAQSQSYIDQVYLVLMLVVGALQAGAYLAWPWRRPEWGLRLQDLLGMVLFGASVFLLMWIIGLWPEAIHGRMVVHSRILSLAARLAVTSGSVIYLLSQDPRRLKGPLGWVLAGQGMAGITLVLLRPLMAAAHAGDPVNPWTALAVLAPVFMAMAAWCELPVEVPADRPPLRHPVVDALPYAPFLLVAGFLGLALLRHPSPLGWPLLAFLAITLILVARQFLLLQEVRRANNRLEDRVAQRTLTLERMQAVLLKTERMNALATLGAGLTHDLNNLLGVIRNYAELVQDELKEGQPPTHKALDRILAASDRAGQLTRRLMAFVRREPGFHDALPTGIGETVIATRDILRMLLPANIHLQVKIDPAPLDVEVQSTVLEQVLVNLVTNAKDAMPGGGRVTLWLRAGSMEGGRLAAILDVSDDGPGIPRDIQELVFNAFFTTKPEGKGTGLGLASVRALMETVGGTVDVESLPGEGTTFRLAFPASV